MRVARLLCGSLSTGDRNTLAAALAAHVERMVAVALAWLPQTLSVRRWRSPAMESAMPRYHASIVRMSRAVVEHATAVFWAALLSAALVATAVNAALSALPTPPSPSADTLAVLTAYAADCRANAAECRTWTRAQRVLPVPLTSPASAGDSVVVPLWPDGLTVVHMDAAAIAAHMEAHAAERNTACVRAHDLGLAVDAWWLRSTAADERAWWECDAVLLNAMFEASGSSKLSVSHQRAADEGRWTRCELRADKGDAYACVLATAFE